MAAHIDGFIATVAHTFVIGATAENPATGKKADAVMAAHLASEAALRLVKPGNDNIEVTETVNKVADSFECKVGLFFTLDLFISLFVLARGGHGLPSA